MGEIYVGSSTHERTPKQVLNTETVDAFDGLKTATERSKQGLGTAVFCSHNMKSDMLAALLMLKKVPEFKDKDFVLPMNSMLYKAYWPAEKLLGITLVPVHSPEVRKKHAKSKNKTTLRELSLLDRIAVPKDDVLEAEPALQKYLAASKQALERGGIVVVAPQAQGNLDKLDLTHPRKTFSKFINYMNTQLPGDYSVLPIGVSYPESARLKRPQSGVHKASERMRLEIGKCYTREDVSKAVVDSDGNADLWMYSQIASLLPEEAVKRKS